MEADFRALLLGHAPLGEIVPIIAWGVRPQGSALPALVLNIVAQPTSYTYGDAVDLHETRVQVDTYAPMREAAGTVDRVLAALLSGYSGTVGATEFRAIFLVSRFDDLAEQTVGGPLHRISRDLTIHHKEA